MAAQKMNSKPSMKIGMGDFVYEVIPHWWRPSEGSPTGVVCAGACDSGDRAYLFCRRTPDPVVILDREGKLLGSWGQGIFTRPHGITIGPDNSVYCSDDKGHTVRKFTLEGKLLMTIGTKDQPSDTGYDGKDWRTIKRGGPPFNRPTSVALSPTGDIYVSDGYGNCRVHKFSADGRFLLSWGEPGNGPGQFSIVHKVCIDKQGTVYVADRQNHRVQVFSPNGEFITPWIDMHRPNDLCLGADGNMYVSEGILPGAKPGSLSTAPQVSIRDLSGKLLARLGEADPYSPDCFFSAHGMWVDSHGDIYIGENSPNSTRGCPIPPDSPLMYKLVRQR